MQKLKQTSNAHTLDVHSHKHRLQNTAARQNAAGSAHAATAVCATKQATRSGFRSLSALALYKYYENTYIGSRTSLHDPHTTPRPVYRDLAYTCHDVFYFNPPPRRCYGWSRLLATILAMVKHERRQHSWEICLGCSAREQAFNCLPIWRLRVAR